MWINGFARTPRSIRGASRKLLISRVREINVCWIISLMFRALGRSIIYYTVSIKSLQGVNNR